MVRLVKARHAFRPVLVLTAIAAGACVDSGLPGKNLALEEARVRPPVYNTYDASLDIEPVHFDGRDWMAAGPNTAIAANLLQSVLTGDREVFALATDTPPYSRLYLRTDNGYAPLAATPAAGTAPAASAEEHH